MSGSCIVLPLHKAASFFGHAAPAWRRRKPPADRETASRITAGHPEDLPAAHSPAGIIDQAFDRRGREVKRDMTALWSTTRQQARLVKTMRAGSATVTDSLMRHDIRHLRKQLGRVPWCLSEVVAVRGRWGCSGQSDHGGDDGDHFHFVFLPAAATVSPDLRAAQERLAPACDPRRG